MAAITIRIPWHGYRAWNLATWLQRLGGAAQWIHQTLCALTGHDFMVRREPGRLRLECTHCGHQTRGWVLASHTERARTKK